MKDRRTILRSFVCGRMVAMAMEAKLCDMRISISLPKPCSKDWDTMEDKGQHRFCQTCQQPVLDLTRATDAELVALFSKNDDPPCGRFDPHQLDRVLERSDKQPSMLLPVVFTSLVAMTSACGTAPPESSSSGAATMALATEEEPGAGSSDQDLSSSSMDATGTRIQEKVLLVRGRLLNSATSQAVDSGRVAVLSSGWPEYATSNHVDTDADGRFQIWVCVPSDSVDLVFGAMWQEPLVQAISTRGMTVTEGTEIDLGNIFLGRYQAIFGRPQIKRETTWREKFIEPFTKR